MGTDAPVWGCPVCGQVLTVRPFNRKNGFRFDCYGADSNPHRVTVYLDGLEAKTVLPTLETESRETATETRAENLLKRVSSRLGRKVGPDGKGESGLVGTQTGG